MPGFELGDLFNKLLSRTTGSHPILLHTLSLDHIFLSLSLSQHPTQTLNFNGLAQRDITSCLLSDGVTIMCSEHDFKVM